MARNILIAVDSFKGTLSAQSIARIIRKNWQATHPEDKLTTLALSDGGESFAKTLSTHLKSTSHSTQVVHVDGVSRRTRWYKTTRGQIALIDAATVLGLNKCLHMAPHKRDSFCLGELIRKIAKHEPKQIVIGLGGSGTNDGGFGLARALGWKFFNAKHQEIKQWMALNTLTHMEPPELSPQFPPLYVAADVNNPLLGPKGATKIYGAQKGLTAPELLRAEQALKRLANIVERSYQKEIKSLTHTGAAGGLGFGLKVFGNAELGSGFDFFAKHTKLKKRIQSATLVICAEGRLDQTSFMGKSCGEIAKYAMQVRTPCIMLCGSYSKSKAAKTYFQTIAALEELTTRSNALKNPKTWLKQLTQETARAYKAKT